MSAQHWRRRLTRLLLWPLDERSDDAVPSAAAASDGLTADALALFDPQTRGPVALVFVLDGELGAVEHAVERSRALRASFDHVVYVVDDPDFTALRREGCVFEYVPSRAEQRRHRPHAAWSAFLRDRRDVLIAKWAPSVVISLGTPWDDWLAAIQVAEATAGTPPNAGLAAAGE